MDLTSVRQFFRENPRMWAVVALAVLVTGIVAWSAYGGFGIGISRFFAAEETPIGVPIGLETPVTQQCEIPQSQWQCQTGDCDGDGYPNPAGPTASSISGCNDLNDGNICITGSTPLSQCRTQATPPPAPTPPPPPTSNPTPPPGGGDETACFEWDAYGTFAEKNAIGNPGNIVTAGDGQLSYGGNFNNRCDHVVHFLFNSNGSPTAGGDPTGLSTSTESAFSRSPLDIQPGQSGRWQITYNVGAFSCGRVGAFSAWRHLFNSGGRQDDGGFAVVFNYGKNCSGAQGGGGTGGTVKPKPATLPKTSSPKTASTGPISTGGTCTTTGTPTVGACPEFGVAICRGQACGQPSDGSPAYDLRVGHLDLDPNSGLLYNPGPGDPNDYTTWEWFAPPDTIDQWCDGTFRPGRTGPPSRPPASPNSVRCIDGSSGGVDYSQYPNCGKTISTTACTTPSAPAVQYSPVVCTPQNQTVGTGQSAVLGASGGDGSYRWNVTGGGVVESGGNESISISYVQTGAKVVRVSSAGSSAACNVQVQSAPVVATGQGGITVQKLVRNVTAGDVTPVKSATVTAGTTTQFIINVRSTSTNALGGIVVRDTLPPGMSYQSGSTYVQGQPVGVDTIVNSGLSLGTLQPGESFTVRWSAVADRTGQLGAGLQEVRPPVTITADGTQPVSDDVTLEIQGTGTGYATGPGGIKTGPDDAIVMALIVASAMTLLYTAHTRSPAFRRREAERLSRDQGPLDFRS